MPAIIMHAGAGVLLIIMTNFASPKPNNKNKSTNHKSQITNHKLQITKSNKPHPPIHIPNINNTKSAPKTNITTNAPLHTTNLQKRFSNSK